MICAFSSLKIKTCRTAVPRGNITRCRLIAALNHARKVVIKAGPDGDDVFYRYQHALIIFPGGRAAFGGLLIISYAARIVGGGAKLAEPSGAKCARVKELVVVMSCGTSFLRGDAGYFVEFPSLV